MNKNTKVNPIPQRIDHTGHRHPNTAYAKKMCRAALVEAAEHKAADVLEAAERRDEANHASIEVEQMEEVPKVRRGRKSAHRRSPRAAHPKALASFTSESLIELLDGLTAMEDNLTAVASIEVASVTLRVDGVLIRATLSGFRDWSISVLDGGEE